MAKKLLSQRNVPYTAFESHKPLEIGYLAFFDECEKRAKQGMRQKKCKVCKLYFYEDEM